MATATPSPAPNPDAMKFTLDVRLPGRINAAAGDEVDDAFTAALLAIPGVRAVFGTGDFVTVTREAGAGWDPIVAAVQEAAHLIA
jgi:hypothetical protein